jgi:hypothetical protein
MHSNGPRLAPVGGTYSHDWQVPLKVDITRRTAGAEFSVKEF